MESREAMERFEHAEEVAEEREQFARHAAVMIAIVAALLAIASIAAERASERVLLAQAQSTDAYNELEANSQKKHSDGDAAQILRILGAHDPAALAAAMALQKGVDTKYSPSEARLLAKAMEFEAERAAAESEHTLLQIAEGAFQLGIVLTSIAIVARVRPLLYASGGIGVAGLLFLVDGLVHVVRI